MPPVFLMSWSPPHWHKSAGRKGEGSEERSRDCQKGSRSRSRPQSQPSFSFSQRKQTVCQVDFPEGLGRRASMRSILKESRRLPPLTHTHAHTRTHGETTGCAHSRHCKATDPLYTRWGVTPACSQPSPVSVEARLCAENRRDPERHLEGLCSPKALSMWWERM